MNTIQKRPGGRLRSLIFAGLIAGAGMAASVTHAAPIVEWEYTVETIWLDANFTGGAGTPFQDDTRISWGETDGVEPWAGGTERSGLEIEDVGGQPGTVFTNGPVAPTSSITHYNQAIDADFATLTDATLRTTLSLSAVDPDPFPEDPLGLVESLIFEIEFIETFNSAPCGFPSDSVCDDIFTILLGELDNSFEYLGETYFVSIVTLSGAINPLPNEVCAAAGVANGCIGFTTPENMNTTENFGVLVTRVPSPGVLSILGLGLLGLAFVRRRKIAA